MIMRNLNMSWLCLSLVALLAGGVSHTGEAQTAAGAGKYAVIVHPSNKYTAESTAMHKLVKQLYTKERTAWPGKGKARPFGRKPGSAEKEAFRTYILDLSEAELAKHWIALKQRTGQTAPRALNSARMAIKMVAKYEGAFIVVSAEEAQAAGTDVRVLFTFSD